MAIPNRLPAWLLWLIVAGLLAAAATGCGKSALIGLVPEYPVVRKQWYSLVTEFVEVDSLTPTFRWQPLDIARIVPLHPMERVQVDHVRYEIRIWQTVIKSTGKLVYVQDRLDATEHRITRPLSPGTRYYWSVRAHFEVNGEHRMTEWTLAGYLLRSETVPNESCLRFQTPLEERIGIE
ncbi:hypothetical protein [uncultured Desulfosarcina sp.]|uniref:hypothetical protein n=1 Tax=uncultured Desulfosarcina sp. TaxID=218289 RepID=UPI0029C65F2B|nr:hypothetical protein [uncultured Desulfosarcina sp.]